MTLAEALRNAEKKLAEANIDTPGFDARLLIAHALDLNHTALLTAEQRTLTTDEKSRIDQLIARRATHEPVGRILSQREFWSLNFGLNEATLEPRPDSETVVEVALKFLSTNEPRNPLPLAGRDREGGGITRNDGSYICTTQPGITPPPLTPPARGGGIRILDLGTGTGCLLLALLHELPNATGLGIDSAPRAVEQATRNAETLGLAARAKFQTGSWLEGIAEKFDAIVSNPPYIPAADIATLMPDVREHDPMKALDGGADGFDAYRLLIPQLEKFLKPDGFVIFEVGAGQAAAAADLFSKAGFDNISTHKDLGGIERCVSAQR